MPLRVSQALLSSEVQSLAKFLNDLFGLPVLLQRHEEAARPFWRIESTNTASITRVASGWDDGTRPYILGYHCLSGDEARRVADRARWEIQKRSAIPFYFYDAGWFPPTVTASSDPAGLPVGSYTVSCSILNVDDHETLASDPVTVTLTEPSTLEVYIPSWPDYGLVKRVRPYVAEGDDPRRGDVSTPVTTERGWTRALVSELPDGGFEPTQCMVYHGSMRVDSLNVNLYESANKDGEFDALLTVNVSRPLPLEMLGGYRTYKDGEVVVTDSAGFTYIS